MNAKENFLFVDVQIGQFARIARINEKIINSFICCTEIIEELEKEFPEEIKKINYVDER